MSDTRPSFFNMRILHTSDWHLGRSLHQQDLHAAQAGAMQQIVEIARSQRVDVTIVAGDVFDRAVPPVEAVSLFVATLQQLAEHCVVIVISGNHDSAVRLGYGAELFRQGIHIATSVESVGNGIDVAIDDETARIFPIPFLLPDQARDALKTGDEPLPRSHEAVLGAALERVRANLATEATPPTTSIVIAHAFVTGARESDSERDISVGGVEDVNATIFSGIDYVALGHLHGPQEIRGPDNTVIRYSGSPLRYSFSEAQHAKSVTIVDVDGSGACIIDEVPIIQPRPMVVLNGSLAEVLSEANQTEHSNAWAQVVVTDDARPIDLTNRVRAAYPHALSILHRPTNPPATIGVQSDALVARAPTEIASEFVLAVTNRPTTDSEATVLRDVYESARNRLDS